LQLGTDKIRPGKSGRAAWHVPIFARKELIAKVRRLSPGVLIIRGGLGAAYDFRQALPPRHADTRFLRDAYIPTPVEVASCMADRLRLDEVTIVAGLLQIVVEDTKDRH